MRYARALGGVAAIIALISTFAATPAQASAAAVTCSGWGSGIGFYDEYDLTREGANTAVRTGPYGACGPRLILTPGSSVDISCYVTNDYGSTWTYVHAHTNYGRVYGWVYDGNLQGNGSGKRC
ncbi:MULTISPECIES: hypothetical protein [unclassified Streptomyces]|uniref:hypothetical protein n=1 Tax=unclassified Streptomyces TaxID=2593676 RepID=UPI001181599E|nr:MULTISPECIES: hypothetical protein [unclassified Streptomyces]MDN3251041.1 hypothetical protein [Streptomyces sp. ZSW22]MDN3257816.1 hypothetical protein [Streptomyces sp. MA25(2023)]